MSPTPVALPQMLEARENRALRQRALLEAYKTPLICFTMNIAGPMKNSELIEEGFSIGLAALRRALESAGVPILHWEEEREVTGCTCFCAAEGDAQTLKWLTAGLEDSTPLGRLFDMDVLGRDGVPVSRTELGLPGRTCLLCGRPAKECARSRAHSVEALQNRTRQLLTEAVRTRDSETVARLACRSLLYEVSVTPKPGLVDCRNSGSHRDMNRFTFCSSAAALWPYFQRCALLGMDTAGEPAQETFSRLRPLGMQAEGEMFAATGGVNTHKGAIFSMGLVCAALGRLPRKEWRSPERVLRECAALAEGITERDFHGVTAENARTSGQKLYATYGVTGVRGQAEAGFPAVLEAGLPALEEGLARGLGEDTAGCAALLQLMLAAEDTNLLARGSRDAQREVRQRLAALLEETPYPERSALEALDDAFIARNLSPGGSADLLAITWMLHFLKEEAYV